MSSQYFIRVRPGDFHLGYDVFVVRRGEFLTSDGKTVPLDEAAHSDKPTIILSEDEAQALVEQLSQRGVKAQRGYLEGKLEATERHLADIREVAKLKGNQ